MFRSPRLLLAMLLLVSSLLTACGTGTQAASSGKMKVAFVYVGSAHEEGWTKMHDLGRYQMQQNIPNVETTIRENVSEDPVIAEKAIRELAKQGNRIIFTTSFGFMTPTINVAKDYPKITFIHISGYLSAPNVGTAFGKIEEPRYVSGMIAGRMTKTNTIGYVAAFPIPEVIRGINAFTLGVRQVNPTAKVRVTWTKTWFDPAAERQAADALLNGGADIIAQHQDSPAAQQAAQDRGKYGIGYSSDMRLSTPDATLTSPIWNWGVYYTAAVKQVQAGTWKNDPYWGGWQDGVVDLAPLNSRVPADVRQEAEAAAGRFKRGEQTIYTIFTGPIKDQRGVVRIAAGQAPSTDGLLSMFWFVEGVDGVIPE